MCWARWFGHILTKSGMSSNMSEKGINSAFGSRRTVALTMLRTCVQGMLLEVNVKFSHDCSESVSKKIHNTQQLWLLLIRWALLRNIHSALSSLVRFTHGNAWEGCCRECCGEIRLPLSRNNLSLVLGYLQLPDYDFEPQKKGCNCQLGLIMIWFVSKKVQDSGNVFNLKNARHTPWSYFKLNLGLSLSPSQVPLVDARSLPIIWLAVWVEEQLELKLSCWEVCRVKIQLQPGVFHI